jgi:hypothetical protein
MHKSAMKCNETVGKWCKNKHGASKIIDTLETYQPAGIQLETCAGCSLTNPTRAHPHICQILAKEEGEMPGDNLKRLLEAFDTVEDHVLTLKRTSVNVV